MPIVRRRFMPASPEAVYAAVSDIAGYPRWVGPVHAVHYRPDGPPTVGTTFDEVGRFMGRDVVLPRRVTACDPPRHFAHVCTSGPIKNPLSFDIAPEGEGALLTITAGDEPGRLGGLVKAGAARWVARALEGNLAALAELLAEQTG